MARKTNPSPGKQAGVAGLMLMLIILFGLMALFTLRLDQKSLQLQIDDKTTAALAEAKLAVLGRAGWGALPSTKDDPHNPGTLSCPDTNNDGKANTQFGNCPSLEVTGAPENLGRLPWHTYGTKDLTDGYGDRLWYLLSPNFRDVGTPILPGTVGTISLIGNTALSDIAVVIIAPGPPLTNQNRASSNVSNPNHYLESVVDSNTVQVLNISGQYNDRIQYITAQEIHMAATQRMALELVHFLPYPYPDNSSWLPDSGEWASHGNWHAWRSATQYTGIDNDNATLNFDGCAASYAVRRVGAMNQITRNGRC